MTTWGSANDYKHFLPRIFELTAELRTPYEIWIVFDKLTLAGWTNWNENEQKSIHEFMIALWESIVNDNSEKAEWESKAGIKHLAKLLVEEKTSIFDRKKISGFYDKNENMEEFITWVFFDKMLEKIQQKYFEFETESFAGKISWAEQIITMERKKYNTMYK